MTDMNPTGSGANDKRLLRIFNELCVILGESFQEEKVLTYIQAFLKRIRIPYKREEHTLPDGSMTANLFCALRRRSRRRKTRAMVLAHTDTVVTGGPVIPVTRNGVIRSKGNTILGADNRAGVALALRLAEAYAAGDTSLPETTLLFTFGEEAGLYGAKAFDYKKVKADVALLFDHSGPFGEVVVRSPFHLKLSVRYCGKRAHAGLDPQKGINAIVMASRVISGFTFGRIDDETVWNVGTISGGLATNIVPDAVDVAYEMRSTSLRRAEKLAGKVMKRSRRIAEKMGGSCRMQLTREYRGYEIDDRDRYLKIAKQAMKSVDVRMNPVVTCGGSDANVLFDHRLPCLNLSCGMYKPHSYDEKLDIREFQTAYRFLKQYLALLP